MGKMTLELVEEIYMNISMTLGEGKYFLSKITHTQLYREILLYLTQNL